VFALKQRRRFINFLSELFVSRERLPQIYTFSIGFRRALLYPVSSSTGCDFQGRDFNESVAKRWAKTIFPTHLPDLLTCTCCCAAKRMRTPAPGAGAGECSKSRAVPGEITEFFEKKQSKTL
jgi:hypothetical protein